MDAHVRGMALILEQAKDELDGELYESVSYDDAGRPCEVTPALKADMGSRLINVVLFDVPGERDHFSIIVNASSPITLHIRREARWDWVLKSFGQVEDHVIGVPIFDRKYIIAGQPEREVVAFLQHPRVRECIEALGLFHELTVTPSFVRASFPLTPKIGYTLDELRVRMSSLVEISAALESSSPMRTPGGA